MQVCVPTNAAQIFHLLRRQMLRPFRKPLVVMTPKSLCARAASSIEELANGSFQTVIPDETEVDEKGVKRHRLLRQGLLRPGLEEDGAQKADTAIIRVEQLYPFPHKQFEGADGRYRTRPGGVVPGRAAEPGRVVPAAHYFRENMRDDQKLSYAAGRHRPPPGRRLHGGTTSGRRR